MEHRQDWLPGHRTQPHAHNTSHTHTYNSTYNHTHYTHTCNRTYNHTHHTHITGSYEVDVDICALDCEDTYGYVYNGHSRHFDITDSNSTLRDIWCDVCGVWCVVWCDVMWFDVMCVVWCDVLYWYCSNNSTLCITSEVMSDVWCVMWCTVWLQCFTHNASYNNPMMKVCIQWHTWRRVAWN